MREMLPEDRDYLESVTGIKALSAQVVENFDRGIQSPKLLDALERVCADFLNERERTRGKRE